VLCVFSGFAVKTSSIGILPDESVPLEGWVTVHTLVCFPASWLTNLQHP
jgi:hypothetical protein